MMETSPERWRRIEALMDAALERPAEERESWLHTACEGDVSLFDDVVRLLESGLRTDAFLATPLVDVAARLETLDDTTPEPTAERYERIGPWRIVGELGRGGMGTVFLAEREEHFRQRAALKLIRSGLHLDAVLVRRFVEERQILASLEHANIAHLLDGGITSDGVPWFAMEFVEGERIDSWCDTRRLSVEARLELFCTVCDAVHYAHERQVVHRDLKPSNIMVRPDGEVKLLDFGVAKLLAAGESGAAEVTRTGHRLLTPDYASPEQVRGLTVSPASDVYSLGVLLYELLTGRRPYRITGRTGIDIERAVLTKDPVRPSTAARASDEAAGPDRPTGSSTVRARARGTTPDRLCERLRGEIDGIVLHAIARDPDRRYASAAALAADIRRHLDGLPVVARRPPAFRRLRPAHVAAMAAILAAGAFAWWAGARVLQARSTSELPVVAIGLITDHRTGASSGVASPLADLLATNLARAPSLRVVSSARIFELLAQSGADVADAGAYSAAARRAGASMLVDGSLYSLPDGGLRLDLRRIDVATGDVLDARTVNGGDLFALVDSGTVRITEALGAAAPPGSVADVTTHSEVAFRFYEEGLRVYYRGDYSAAVRLFEAALAEDSTFAMAAYYAFRSTPDPDRRIPFINRAVSLAEAASDRERLIIRSAWATWTSDPTALAVTETLTVRFPAELEGYISRGLVLAQVGDNGAALENFRHVIRADSFAPAGTSARCLVCDARLYLIETYVFIDSTAIAEREARLWTEREPLRAESWRLLSAILSTEDRDSEGRDAWRRAADIDRSLNGHPQFFAWFYLQTGDYETADRELRQIAGTGSPDRQLDAWWYLTLSLRRQGRFDEALETARIFRERSVAARPAETPHTFSFNQAHVLFEMGRFLESGALFDSIAAEPVGFSPSHRARYRAFALSLGANALAAAGDTAGLDARADTIAALASQSLLIRDRFLPDYVRGLLFAARHDDRAAIEAFTRARYAPADFTRINLELARALLRMERPADAVAVLQPAVRASMEGSHLYTTRTELEDLLATAWDEIGNADSALVHYRVAQRAWQRADPTLADRVSAINARILALDPPARDQRPPRLP